MRSKPFQVPVARLLWNGKGLCNYKKGQVEAPRPEIFHPWDVSTPLLLYSCSLSLFQNSPVFSKAFFTPKSYPRTLFPDPVLAVAFPSGQSYHKLLFRQGLLSPFVICLIQTGSVLQYCSLDWKLVWTTALSGNPVGKGNEAMHLVCQRQAGRQDLCMLCRTPLRTSPASHFSQ